MADGKREFLVMRYQTFNIRLIYLWQQGNAMQNAQKGRSARPQRVKGRGVPSGVR